MTRATSIGAAVTSHTSSPESRCCWAIVRVPGQSLSIIFSSTMISASSDSSRALRSAMKASALLRDSSMWSGSSTPAIRK